jgi:hypothetical protein
MVMTQMVRIWTKVIDVLKLEKWTVTTHTVYCRNFRFDHDF